MTDDQQRQIASEIEQNRPAWLVMWGCYTRLFWAYPKFMVPSGTIVSAFSPYQLLAGMDSVEAEQAERNAAAQVPAQAVLTMTAGGLPRRRGRWDAAVGRPAISAAADSPANWAPADSPANWAAAPDGMAGAQPGIALASQAVPQSAISTESLVPDNGGQGAEPYVPEPREAGNYYPDPYDYQEDSLDYYGYDEAGLMPPGGAAY